MLIHPYDLNSFTYKVSKKIERNIIQEIDLHAIVNGEECLACEGWYDKAKK